MRNIILITIIAGIIAVCTTTTADIIDGDCSVRCEYVEDGCCSGYEWVDAQPGQCPNSQICYSPDDTDPSTTGQESQKDDSEFGKRDENICLEPSHVGNISTGYCG